MTHPFKKQFESTRAQKAASMSKNNNLDIPVMRGVGENRAGGVYESRNIQQQNKQANSPGMKSGGRIGGGLKPATKNPKGDIPKAITEGGEGDGPYPIQTGSHSGSGRMQKAKAYERTGIKPIKGGAGH